MNRPSTAKEALIAEALGEMASLIDRMETLAPELQASRQALVLSHKELVKQVTVFKTQMTEVIGFAKVQTAKHIGQSADVATKKLIAIQTESMQSAGRDLFRAEIHPVIRQVAQQLQALAERQSSHVATIWTYAGVAIGGAALSLASVAFWTWLLRP
jgi:hypothetical protein